MQKRLEEYEALWHQETKRQLALRDKNLKEMIISGLDVYTKKQLEENFFMRNEISFLTKKIQGIAKENFTLAAENRQLQLEKSNLDTINRIQMNNFRKKIQMEMEMEYRSRKHLSDEKSNDNADRPSLIQCTDRNKEDFIRTEINEEVRKPATTLKSISEEYNIKKEQIDNVNNSTNNISNDKSKIIKKKLPRRPQSHNINKSGDGGGKINRGSQIILKNNLVLNGSKEPINEIDEIKGKKKRKLKSSFAASLSNVSNGDFKIGYHITKPNLRKEQRTSILKHMMLKIHTKKL